MLAIGAPDARSQIAAVPDQAPPPDFPALARNQFVAFVRREFDDMKRFRSGRLRFDDRIAYCLRARLGQYDHQTLSQIREFQGSEIYARLTSNKSRAAAAMLRELFVGDERPWQLEPSPVPANFEPMLAEARQLVMLEMQMMQAQGTPIDEKMIADRASKLYEAVARAARREARDKTRTAGMYIDDLLVEGGYYEAMEDFLEDFVTYPIAVMKGPVVHMVRDVQWVNGQAQIQNIPRMKWQTVRPHRLWWTPGAFDVDKSDFIEIVPCTRTDIMSFLNVPGFDNKAIRQTVMDHANGYREYHHDTSEINRLEGRHDTLGGDYEFIDMIEYNGRVHGRDLDDMGVMVNDLDADYLVRAWIVNNNLLKIQVDPDPRQRMPYYLASYEPVPGSLVGNALPELMGDLQQAANATLRALINNLSIASGPQVVVNLEALANPEDGNTLYPWKRWHVDIDPTMVGTQNYKPVDFFQPNSNVQELLFAYQNITNIADEVTAVPRYLSGNEKVGGAARTASGLSMLLGNATRTMKAVAAQIDENVQKPLIQKLYDMVMLTTSAEFLQGDDMIVVKGATRAEQLERDKMRMLELLQITGNPVDQAIMGIDGRAEAIRQVARHMGVKQEDVLPTMDEVQQRLQMLQGGGPDGVQMASQTPPPPPGGDRVAAPVDNRQRTRNMA